MKEPLAVLTWESGTGTPTRSVGTLLEAGAYAEAISALWDVATRLIQGEENLSLQTFAGWIESFPAPWNADTRVRYLHAWVLFEQCRTMMSLIELDRLAGEWTPKIGGPEDTEARRWFVLIRLAQGTVYEADGRQDRARAAFAEAYRCLPEGLSPNDCPTLELDPQEAERLAALDPMGQAHMTVKALTFFHAFGNRAGLARVAHNLGHQYLDVGEPARARYWLEQALELKRSQPGDFPLVYTLDSLGRCYQQLGLLAEAQAVLDEALRVAARLECVAIQASSLSCLGDVYRDRDEIGPAMELYHRSLSLREQLRDSPGLAETHLAIGTLQRRAGHAGLAADCAAEARTSGQGRSTPAVRAVADMHAAIAGTLLGDPTADGDLARSVAVLSESHVCSEEVLGRWYLALAAWRQERPEEAAAQLRRALALAARNRLMHVLAMELPATAGLCALALGPTASAEALGGLVQRASARGLLALLQAVPEAQGVVAAAGRLPEATALSIQLLGAFRVMRAGREIDMGAARSQKAVSLFKFLVAQRGRVVAREQILDAIWPEADPDSADRSFEVTLSTLRRLLDPPQGVTLIVRRGRGYMLNPDVPLLLDLERFRSHLERGNWWWNRGQAALAMAEWEHAEAAYGGDFLADDPYEDWATADRERLREQYLDLVLRLGEAALEHSRPAEAVERALRVLVADPIREAAYRLLMRAHARQGNRALALRDLQRCSEVLREELGEEPMSETRDLARRIRAGEV
ncbi:MAG TPA: BTAD domain-containing putative transcriptional regulator [Symbiobacteriaceae bacterium]|nr:BTAD domain-containing putative transcriptional regulator [Symbiobacteriaceae bacterium]